MTINEMLKATSGHDTDALDKIGSTKTNNIKAKAIEEMADYYSNALIISVTEMRNYAKRLRGEK